jgi:hypothetical protein
LYHIDAIKEEVFTSDNQLLKNLKQVFYELYTSEEAVEVEDLVRFGMNLPNEYFGPQRDPHETLNQLIKNLKLDEMPVWEKFTMWCARELLLKDVKKNTVKKVLPLKPEKVLHGLYLSIEGCDNLHGCLGLFFGVDQLEKKLDVAQIFGKFDQAISTKLDSTPEIFMIGLKRWIVLVREESTPNDEHSSELTRSNTQAGSRQLSPRETSKVEISPSTSDSMEENDENKPAGNPETADKFLAGRDNREIEIPLELDVSDFLCPEAVKRVRNVASCTVLFAKRVLLTRVISLLLFDRLLKKIIEPSIQVTTNGIPRFLENGLCSMIRESYRWNTRRFRID